MATRRSFTFGTLVLALTGATAAQAGTNKVGKAASAPSLGWRHRVRHEKGVLTVHLTVTNRGSEPVETVVTRGNGPGAYLQAQVDIEGEPLELAPILGADRRKMLMSRMGPLPQWAPLAAGESVEHGPYRFAWPTGVPPLEVALTGGVDTMDGFSEFEATVSPSTDTVAS